MSWVRVEVGKYVVVVSIVNSKRDIDGWIEILLVPNPRMTFSKVFAECSCQDR